VGDGSAVAMNVNVDPSSFFHQSSSFWSGKRRPTGEIETRVFHYHGYRDHSVNKQENRRDRGVYLNPIILIVRKNSGV
jgi:hypothetical protein